MAYQFQLKDAQNDIGLKNVSGVVSTSAQFIQLVNEVCRRLSRRGDWYGMTQTAVFVFQGNTVTWPRYVGTVLGARNCRSRGIRPQNMWFSFTGSYHHHHSNWHADLVLEDVGQVSTYNEITGGGNGQLIRFYVEKPQDIGKKITLYGTAYGNQPLMQQVSGVWQNGLTLIAASPYASTAVNVINIESVIKDPMQGVSRLYEYDASSDTMRDIGLYAPNETNPTYRRSRIVNFRNRWHQPTGSTTPIYSEIEVLVKLAFIPAVSPLDFLLVDNFDALKLGIQAVKAEEAGDVPTSEAFWLKAIRELNFEDRDKMPDMMTPIKVDAMMTHHVAHNPI